MKNKDEFTNFYNETFKKELSKYSIDKKKDYFKKKKLVITELIIIILIIIVGCYFLYNKDINIYYKISIMALLLVFYVLIVILNLQYLKKIAKEISYLINTYIYTGLLYFLSNDNYFFDNNTQLAIEDFNKMNLFNLDYLRYTGNNLTALNYNNKKVIMCDVYLYDLVERIKTDSYYQASNNTEYIINYHYNERVDIFKGLYFETTINRDNDEYIYMIPNNISDKFVNKNIYHYINYDVIKVDLENLEFSEKYCVFSLDEIKSRYILSLTLMERINYLDSKIKNKKYFVFKKDGRVGIFIDGLSIENLLEKKIKLEGKITFDYVNSFFNELKKIIEISQMLEDINTYGN